MKDIDFQILQLISGNFLTKCIPNNWYELSLEEQNNFLKAHVWQPLENLDVSFLWESIENSATATQRFIENLKGDFPNSHD